MTHRVPAVAVPPQAESAERERSARRLRVLLIEDDDADAFLVGELFDEAGAAVDLVNAKSLADARLRLAGADRVLLDLGLPDAQGLDGLCPPRTLIQTVKQQGIL